MQDEQKQRGIGRYRTIGDLKRFWLGDKDEMHLHVDLDALERYIHEREVANLAFPLLAISRADVAMAFADEDDIEPSWPYELTDSQMKALSARIQQYLTSDGAIFWDCIRDFCRELVLTGGEQEEPKQGARL